MSECVECMCVYVVLVCLILVQKRTADSVAWELQAAGSPNVSTEINHRSSEEQQMPLSPELSAQPPYNRVPTAFFQNLLLTQWTKTVWL